MYKGHLPFYTMGEMFSNWKKKNNIEKFHYKYSFIQV